MNREKLLSICDRAFFHESKWYETWHPDLMTDLGMTYALLKCGCEFRILANEDIFANAFPADTVPTEDEKKQLLADIANSIYIEFNFLSEQACALPVDDIDGRNKLKIKHVFSLPTEQFLASHPVYSPIPPTPPVAEPVVEETVVQPIVEQTPAAILAEETTTTPTATATESSISEIDILAPDYVFPHRNVMLELDLDENSFKDAAQPFEKIHSSYLQLEALIENDVTDKITKEDKQKLITISEVLSADIHKYVDANLPKVEKPILPKKQANKPKSKKKK